VVAEHERYEEVHAILHGRVAADSLKAVIVEGGATLHRALEALKASHVKRVGTNLLGCAQATPEVMARVTAALPASLEHLTVLGCEGLTAFPELSQLNQLRSLNLYNCHELASLPDVSELKQLRSLDLRHCEKLASLPDVTELKQLRTLKLSFCSELASLPDVSELKQLTDFRKPDHLDRDRCVVAV